MRFGPAQVIVAALVAALGGAPAPARAESDAVLRLDVVLHCANRPTCDAASFDATGSVTGRVGVVVLVEAPVTFTGLVDLNGLGLANCELEIHLHGELGIPALGYSGAFVVDALLGTASATGDAAGTGNMSGTWFYSRRSVDVFSPLAVSPCNEGAGDVKLHVDLASNVG